MINIATGILLVILIAILGLIRNRNTTLVLQKFHFAVQPEPVPDATVEIIGRVQGIMAYLMSLMGFSPITRFTIAGPQLTCQSTSLFGQRSQFIPLRCISSVAAGVHKPISYIVIAMIILVLGALISLQIGEPLRSTIIFLTSILISGLLITRYFSLKKFFIEVYADGGPPIFVLFKPNVLEGVPIDIDQALALIAVIRDLVLQQGTAPDATASRTPLTAEAPPAENQNSHPPFQRGFANGDEDHQANELLTQAKQAARKGQREVAISISREIIRKFPNTPAADQARRSLKKIDATA